MTGTARWALFTTYVVTSVTGLAILKNFLPRLTFPIRLGTAPPLRIGLWIASGSALYVMSFALWLVILRNTPLAIAYPAAVGATLCGTTAVAACILGESIGVVQGTGIALIVVGIVLVFRGA
jgi:multidrug transporter EmrE-like cation transporter